MSVAKLRSRRAGALMSVGLALAGLLAAVPLSIGSALAADKGNSRRSCNR